MPNDDDLTLTEAALLTNISKETLKRACQKAQITGAYKRSTIWFVSPEALTHWHNNRPHVGRPAKKRVTND